MVVMYNPLSTIKDSNDLQLLKSEVAKAVSVAKPVYDSYTDLEGNPFVQRAYRMFNYTHNCPSLLTRICAILHAYYPCAGSLVAAQVAVQHTFSYEVHTTLSDLHLIAYYSPGYWAVKLEEINNPIAHTIKMYDAIDTLNMLQTITPKQLTRMTVKDDNVVVSSARIMLPCLLYSTYISDYLKWSPEDRRNNLIDLYKVSIRDMLAKYTTKKSVPQLVATT